MVCSHTTFLSDLSHKVCTIVMSVNYLSDFIASPVFLMFLNWSLTYNIGKSFLFFITESA